MALIKCCECGQEVSEYADKCPNCGCPIEIIKSNKSDKLYTIINGQKKDVTYFVNKILDKSYEKDMTTLRDFNISLMDELDVSMIGFVKAVEECGGAPEYYNDKSIKQWKQEQDTIQASKPKCPHCQSTNIKKLSLTNKAISIGGLGILSNKIGKTFQCNNCKYTW